MFPSFGKPRSGTAVHCDDAAAPSASSRVGQPKVGRPAGFRHSVLDLLLLWSAVTAFSAGLGLVAGQTPVAESTAGWAGTAAAGAETIAGGAADSSGSIMSATGLSGNDTKVLPGQIINNALIEWNMVIQ
jgi:hypothetical protein